MGADAKDERWQTVNDLLYQGCLRRSKFRFVERYIHNVLILHLHCLMLVNSSKVMDRFIKFCAVLEHDRGNATGKAFGSDDGVPSVDDCNSGLKVAVLVDVRENREHPHQVMEPLKTIVRLQTLDECICVNGNPVGQIERSKRNGRDTFIATRPFQEQGELSPRILLGEWADKCPPDKIEKQVIQRRPELVKNLTEQYGNINGRLLGDLQFGCAVRLNDLFVRVSATVFGDGILNSLLVLHGPEDFSAGGFNSGKHPRILSREFKG